MTVWQVQPLAKRYLRGRPAMQRVGTGRAATVTAPAGTRAGWRSAPPPLAVRPGTSVAPALGWLLGGYALITGLVGWMLSTGHARDEPILALAPLSLLISICVAVGALGVTVFAGRRYFVGAMAVLGLGVGIAVASACALVTAAL
jgi:hypothetical protein